MSRLPSPIRRALRSLGPVATVPLTESGRAALGAMLVLYAALGLEDWEYEKIEVTDLPAFLTSAGEDYRGFSVTMPLKFDALACADNVSERAQLIGSANTLVRTDDGWRADNTDTEGVLGALEELGVEGSSALLIGAGGTARPVLWGLAQRGVLVHAQEGPQLRMLGNARQQGAVLLRSADFTRATRSSGSSKSPWSHA